MVESPEPLGTGEGGSVLELFPGGSGGVSRDLPGWRTRLARKTGVSVFYLLGEGVEVGGGPSYGQRYSPGCLEEGG